jgi:hypothetical protein
MAIINIETLFQTLKTNYPKLLLSIFQAFFIWTLILVIHRRYFHPLSKIPGPALPAVTRLYLWYYTIIEEGQFYRKIEELHKIYGNP